MVTWPPPKLTTVDGEVVTIFSAAKLISKLLSYIGNVVDEPLVDWFEWEKGDWLCTGLALGSMEDIPVSFLSLKNSLRKAAIVVGSVNCEGIGGIKAGLLHNSITALRVAGSNWVNGFMRFACEDADALGVEFLLPGGRPRGRGVCWDGDNMTGVIEVLFEVGVEVADVDGVGLGGVSILETTMTGGDGGLSDLGNVILVGSGTGVIVVVICTGTGGGVAVDATAVIVTVFTVAAGSTVCDTELTTGTIAALVTGTGTGFIIDRRICAGIKDSG